MTHFEVKYLNEILVVQANVVHEGRKDGGDARY